MAAAAASGVIYYRFKSLKYFEDLPLDEPCITIRRLKEMISERKRRGQGRTRHDHLIVYNAQTNEEYADENEVVHGSTAVVIRRVPGPPRNPIVVDRRPAVVEEEQAEQAARPGGSEWDDFGEDVYSVPQVPPPVEAPAVKIKARVDDERRPTPPRGYVCHRCGVAGHFIHHCPTNGDPSYDTARRAKAPPPAGEDAVPPELRCQVCKEAMRDAVFARCCFMSFCDACIRGRIAATSTCVCGAAGATAEGIVPNITVRETISRVLASTALKSSSSTGEAERNAKRRLPPQFSLDVGEGRCHKKGRPSSFSQPRHIWSGAYSGHHAAATAILI